MLTMLHARTFQQLGLIKRMPRYVYRCMACKETFEISHGMFHDQRECILCHRVDELVKVPAFSISKKVETKGSHPPGKIVDDYISEAKKEIKEEKKKLKKQEFKQ